MRTARGRHAGRAVNAAAARAGDGWEAPARPLDSQGLGKEEKAGRASAAPTHGRGREDEQGLQVALRFSPNRVRTPGSMPRRDRASNPEAPGPPRRQCGSRGPANGGVRGSSSSEAGHTQAAHGTHRPSRLP